jgi:hypothetical protein
MAFYRHARAFPSIAMGSTRIYRCRQRARFEQGRYHRHVDVELSVSVRQSRDRARSFAKLRDLLLRAVNEPDGPKFRALANEYINARTKFFAKLAPDDHKYFAFQLWQEGIARYTEVRSAEAAGHYQPTPQFAALADYESFRDFAQRKRSTTLDELQHADLAGWKRIVVYSFGATEGFLLDRINPNWKEEYFRPMLSTDSFFATAN